MTGEELIPISDDWLNALPVGVCNRCQRQMWAESELGIVTQLFETEQE